MKKEDIHLGDWQRILLGNAPLEFLLEAALRTLVVYLVLLVTMRLLGKRMNGQLSVAELSVMIMLGGIVSVPMEVPDRGLLHGVLVLAYILGLFRLVNWLAFKYRRVERLTRGELKIVVTDGVLDLPAMANTKLSREQLFANLQAEKIQHLGQLKRVYLEGNGEFSLYPQTPPRPGLSILPAKDAAIRRAAPAGGGQQACRRCGHTEPAAPAGLLAPARAPAAATASGRPPSTSSNPLPMKPEDIHLGDWTRILVGEVPASFYLEAVLRVVFIYLLLLASMRLMGNRMGKVLTRNEMVAMVSLAAANGVALMAPDRGLLPVVVVAAVIIGYQQLIAWRAFRNKRFESLVLDDLSVLVEDGRLHLDKLEQSVLCRTQVLAKLRKEGIAILGNVRRAYQEANGNFSVIPFDDGQPRPGLSILPTIDTAFREEQPKADGQFACASCGHLQPATPAAGRRLPSLPAAGVAARRAGLSGGRQRPAGAQQGPGGPWGRLKKRACPPAGGAPQKLRCAPATALVKPCSPKARH